MRISDWSSDVCSSDLAFRPGQPPSRGSDQSWCHQWLIPEDAGEAAPVDQQCPDGLFSNSQPYRRNATNQTKHTRDLDGKQGDKSVLNCCFSMDDGCSIGPGFLGSCDGRHGNGTGSGMARNY